MIKIICVGKIKEKYLTSAVEEYQKRISKYTKIEIIEVLDEGIEDINKVLKLEGERIKKYLSPKDYIITLEIKGQEISSLEFTNFLEKINFNYSNITFIIGGSYGISEEIRKCSNYHLSFSKLTFPHQLFRVLLLEQIYRTYKIRNNEKYHK